MLTLVPLSSPTVNMCCGAMFSDLTGFFYSTAGKMYGKGEEEDLTRLMNIFIHFPSLLSSF